MNIPAGKSSFHYGIRTGIIYEITGSRENFFRV